MAAREERLRAPSTHEEGTAERVLAVVVQILEQGGAGALRIADVAQRSHASIGSIYHHFGSREGLINAAWQWLYDQSADSIAQDHVADLLAAASPKALVSLLADVIIDGELGQELAMRRRLEVLGTAVSSPGLQEHVIERHAAALDHVAKLGEALRARGWLAQDVDPQSFAMLVEVLALGPALSEMSHLSVTESQWRDLVTRVLRAIVFGE